MKLKSYRFLFIHQEVLHNDILLLSPPLFPYIPTFSIILLFPPFNKNNTILFPSKIQIRVTRFKPYTSFAIRLQQSNT